MADHEANKVIQRRYSHAARGKNDFWNREQQIVKEHHIAKAKEYSSKSKALKAKKGDLMAKHAKIANELAMKNRAHPERAHREVLRAAEHAAEHRGGREN